MAGHRKSGTLSPRTFQEYLSALAEQDGLSPHHRHKKLLFSYAELQFRLTGGGRCAVCRAHVRHVVPVVCEGEDGSTSTYECLCTRCLEAEKAGARVVTLHIGQAVVRYSNGVKLHAEPAARASRPSKAAGGRR